MKLQVRIKIGRRVGVGDWDTHLLIVNINKQPIEGAANKQLIEILSDALSIPKRDISIIRGHTARLKLLDIPLDEEEFLARVRSI